MTRFKKVLVIVLALLFLSFPSASATKTNFELIEEANKQQKIFEEKWNKLIEDGTIEVGTGKLKGGGERPLYKFTGDDAGELKLQDVFSMLQNWPQIQESKKQKLAFIEVPVAGENVKFRITESPFTKGQIYIQNEAGKKGIKYTDFFKKINDRNIDAKQVSKFILELADSNLNQKTQTEWEKNYPFLNSGDQKKDEEVKEAISEIMVVAQVAEPARPSDESFAKWKNAMTEITKVVLKTRETEWKDATDAIFTAQKITPETFDYEQFYDLAKKWTAPGANKDTVWKEITTLLGDTEAEKITDQDKFYNKIKKSLENVGKSERKQFEKHTKPLKLKGRVPSSDEVFRQTLQAVVDQEGSEPQIKEHFDHLFKIYKTTPEGRYDTVFNTAIGKKRARDNSDSEDSELTPPSKKQRTDPAGKAKGEHDGKVIKTKIR